MRQKVPFYKPFLICITLAGLQQRSGSRHLSGLDKADLRLADPADPVLPKLYHSNC